MAYSHSYYTHLLHTYTHPPNHYTNQPLHNTSITHIQPPTTTLTTTRLHPPTHQPQHPPLHSPPHTYTHLPTNHNNHRCIHIHNLKLDTRERLNNVVYKIHLVGKAHVGQVLSIHCEVNLKRILLLRLMIVGSIPSSSAYIICISVYIYILI